MPRPPRRPSDPAAGRSEEAGDPDVQEDRPGRDEPLAASWRPLDDPDSRKLDSGELDPGEFGTGEFGTDEPAARKRRGVWSFYGWRIYAVPLLIVVSALAVFQAADPRAGRPPERNAAPHVPAPNVPEAPVVTEAPPGQNYDPKLFSADLPPGAAIPAMGGRTFDVLPGTSPRVGGGDLYRYTVEVEVGVQLAEGNESFAQLTTQTLTDPRSWTNPQAGGIALERVDASGTPDFRVTLVSQNTAREICGYGNGLPFDTSCRIGDRVYINAARWVRGAVSFEGDIGTYRRYAINHEVGHVFGNGHVPCGQQGGLAPVMMQQTFSVANNELHELNKVVPQGTEIPANGFVCKYNAWPFPVVDRAGP